MQTAAPSSPPALPEGFSTTVEQFAARMGLDSQSLLRGGRFDYKGLAFRLEHHAPLDPSGLYVLTELGEFTPQNEAFLCRRLLELNLIVPAARLGYFGLAPSLNIAFFCVRIELAGTPDAHAMVAAVLESQAGELQRTLGELTRAAEQVNAASTAAASAVHG